MKKIIESNEPEQITEPAENRITLYELSQQAKAKDSTIRRELSINDIEPSIYNPYKVIDNDEMKELVESIQENGILTPLMVRRLENSSDKYELISGHRRLFAAKKAGLEKVPAFVYEISRDEAAVMVVDSNLHREHILPSEKAFAYKLKYAAMKRQGNRTDLTSSQNETKSRTDEEIASESGESRATVQRYIHLTNLIPEMLDLMDKNEIAFSVGVELSYLDEDTQYELMGIMEETDHKPSYAQANHMHKDYIAGTLTGEKMEEMLSSDKPNQKPVFKLSAEKFEKYIASDVSNKEAEDFFLKACDYYSKYLIRKRDKDAR